MIWAGAWDMEEKECRYLGRGMKDGEDKEFRKEWRSRKVYQLLTQILFTSKSTPLDCKDQTIVVCLMII